MIAISRDRIQSKLTYPRLAGLFIPLITAVFAPRIMAIMPLVAALFLLDWPVIRKNPRLLLTEPLLWIVAVIALCGVSSLWSIDPKLSLASTGRAAFVLLSGALLLVAARIKFEPVPRSLLTVPLVYAIATLLLALDLMLNMPLYDALHGAPRGNISGTALENRGVIFCALLYFPMLAIGFLPRLVTSKNQRAGFIAMLTLPLLFLLYETQSQSAQLAIGLGLAVMAGFPYGWKRGWYILSAVIAAAVLTAPWLSIWMFHELATRLQNAPFFGTGQGYSAQRLEIWDYVSRYALRRPWLGFGMEATRAVPAFDSHQIYQTGTTILHPHNFAVQLWMEFGVWGALLGTALLCRIVVVISQWPRQAQRFALPLFIASISIAAMTYGMWQGWWVGLLVFVAALTLLARENIGS